MSDTLKVLSQYLIPQHGISLLMGKIAESENVKIKNTFIKWFIKRYGVDMTIAERENPEDYKTFNDFFTRTLKAGARPIDDDEQSIVHPADGAVSQFGKIDNGYIFQAKGHTYSAKTLLGGDADLAAPFQAESSQRSTWLPKIITACICQSMVS